MTAGLRFANIVSMKLAADSRRASSILAQHLLQRSEAEPSDHVHGST
jgi:hypothetical protein